MGAEVVDVRITGGRIAAVATEVAADGAEIVDCDGRALIRGLWDEHVHVTQAALAGRHMQLGTARSAVEAADLVRVASAPRAGGGLLVGVGFRDAVWPDVPTLAALDAAAEGRPVVLQSHDIHTVWLNRAAGRALGVSLDASGLVREAAAFEVAARVNGLAAAGSDAAVADLAARAAARGVVGVVDFEMAWNRGVWLERIASGFDALRIEAAVYPRDLERAIEADMRSGQAVDGGADLLTVGPLKVLINGALNTRTAFCADPYPDGTHGLLTVLEKDLGALLARCRGHGFVPAVHAIGDAAVTVALDAFSAAGIGGRIEHAQLLADTDVVRFPFLGVTASVQPAHLLDDREVAERLWPGRTGRIYPFRSLLDAGATLAFGSDAPVAQLDPWLAIRAAVGRETDPGDPWHPEQRITPEEALAASTRGRAAPRVGDVADLALLEEPIGRMHGDAVAATLLGGRFTHRGL